MPKVIRFHPTSDPYQAAYAGGLAGDVFVSKFSSSGEILVYSTYLGGSNSDYGWGLAVDGSGRAYVGGKTQSVNFPTRDPYQASKAASGGVADAFLAKLDSSGSSLIYSTYLGGSSGEMGGGEGNCGVAVDEEGCAYLTGATVSNDFPTRNAYQAARSGMKAEVFVSKFSSSGSSLVYSTYLGGSVRDEGWAIAVDMDLRAYVTGLTCSSDFPTANAYASSLAGDDDAFFAALTYYPTPSPRPTHTPTPSVTSSPSVTPTPRYTHTPTPSPPTPHSPFPILDFNGDGTSDIAIFRENAGLWAIRGVTRVYFGASSDEPVSADYRGSGTDDIGIFRSSSGLWAIKGITRVYYGSSSDLPVTR